MKISYGYFVSFSICGALHDLVSFVQFKNVKNTNGGVLILKLQLKLTLLNGCFSRFLNTQMVPNRATHHIC